MDIYKEITDRIIAEMEQGIIPWEKPWVNAGRCVSHTTGKSYSLLNQMLLGRSGEYVTFKQCQQEGGRVRKGEKAHMVVFWKWVEQEDEETGEILSYEEMKELQARIQTVLKEKAHDTHELLTYAKELDAEMIERNISPGGNADLLALTYFIYLYEQEL